MRALILSLLLCFGMALGNIMQGPSCDDGWKPLCAVEVLLPEGSGPYYCSSWLATSKYVDETSSCEDRPAGAFLCVTGWLPKCTYDISQVQGAQHDFCAAHSATFIESQKECRKPANTGPGDDTHGWDGGAFGK